MNTRLRAPRLFLWSVLLLPVFLIGCTDSSIEIAPNDPVPRGTPVCGNGFVEPGEECDDGNTNNSDACLSSCVFPLCGNGLPDPGEVCDDGNRISGDGCKGNCLKIEQCGDGLLDVGEKCDDGNAASGDGCRADCKGFEQCGDGRRDVFEDCDNGALNGTEGNNCRVNCTLTVGDGCGDGDLDLGEQCDDANNLEGDGCQADCRLPDNSSCGDGILQPGEVCDDGNRTGGDGCREDCLKIEACGDGLLDTGEACDDGNAMSFDGCRADCLGFEACGDGLIDPDEACDDANLDSGDGCDNACAIELCGDGIVNNVDEECDDGNTTPNDGCDHDCALSQVIQVSAGGLHTCAILRTGEVKCWGTSENGQLGYGNLLSIGDDETPASAGNVNIGGPVAQLSAGASHTCALLDNGNVRCWGAPNEGRLGYGNLLRIGDNEAPVSAGDVNVGGLVTQLSTGASHTCALLDSGDVKCWGINFQGQLGYGNSILIGDNEAPASVGNIDMGGTVVQITSGGAHNCALLDTGNIRCWGFGAQGQLGYGNTNSIGGNETPASAGDVFVGGVVQQLDAGEAHNCALLDNGNVRCWGEGSDGRLGYANTNSIGDNETPASTGDVNIGGPVAQISAGGFHTCALLETGTVRCWGRASEGQLGYGNLLPIGDNEQPINAGDVNVGGAVVQITTGIFHTCALLDSGDIRCWGLGTIGTLGYGDTQNIGDDESPASAGSVVIF